ncbi:unnamed protein product [Cylindrotheca closterium]|uniref:Uncharacterized protein n=1 Tax=Cylindrotheca closterium TaxID=2856 RepID=A0AAD2FWM8_9STRA|nr:unnamed protein product [Cylindrotheca closterium]
MARYWRHGHNVIVSILAVILCFSQQTVSFSIQLNHRASAVSVRRITKVFTSLHARHKQLDHGHRDDEETSPSSILSGNPRSSSSKLKSLVESAVQSIIGDQDYLFGDYTKKRLSDLTGKDYNSSNATYEIGEITSDIVSHTGGVILGNDQYRFGDLTSRAIRGAEVSLHTWKGRTLDPVHLYNQYMDQFTPDQRNILIVAFIRLLAIALVTWGFYGNLATSLYFCGGWLQTCVTAPPTDLMLKQHHTLIGLSKAFWKANSPLIIRNFIKVRLVFAPLMLILQGAATVFSVLPMEKFVTFMERKWIPKGIQSRFPVWTHGIALVLLFAIGIVILSLVSSIGVATGTTLAYLFKWQI